MQAAVNTKAGAHFGLSLVGPFFTFFIALVLLTVAAAIEARVMQIPFLLWSARPQIHHLLPGLIGVAFVAGGVIVSAQVGAALFWIPLICGQLTASAVLDHFGLSTAGGEKKPIDAFKSGALVLAVVGAVLSVAERLNAPGKLSPGVILAYEVAALIIGALTPVQAALSRAAVARLPSRLAATWWSFAVGLVSIAIALGAQAGIESAAAAAFSARFDDSLWWYYTGGIFGVAYIGTTIFWAPRIGSARYFVALVSGQLAGSAAIDATGALGFAVTPLGPERGVGIALVLVAATLLAVGRAAFSPSAVAVSHPIADTEAATNSSVKVGLLYATNATTSRDVGPQQS